MPRLLIVDDEADVAEFLAEVGRQSGFDALAVRTLDEVRRAIADQAPEVMTLDLQMPGLDGVQLLRHLAEMNVKAGILLISGTDARVRNTSLRLGSELGLRMLGTLQKPVHVVELEKVLRRELKPAAPTADSLRQAIANREIIVHYQPQVHLLQTVGRVVGVEALARWQHPQRGLVQPSEFIALAESSGLIRGLTRNVFETAVLDQRKWREAGLDLTVAINFSAELLGDLELPDLMSKHIGELGGDNSRIKVEITESGTMRDVMRSMDVLTRLRIKGFALSLDDFGTGFSSLVQLYRLPFSELKIDKSFVMDFESNPEAETIARITIDLARNLGLQVCAEGVESEAAYRHLEKLGCPFAQGYWISRPVPAAAIPGLAHQWRPPVGAAA
jgi:EAL domain-containing protein (putative c-di-GMP-specific phosphodiesterase class I)